MKKENIVIWLPALVGSILLVTVIFDLHLFKSGNTSVDAMLSRELPLALAGLVGVLVTCIYTGYSVMHKQWRQVIKSLVSILVFFICFVVAGINGGAFLNAT